MNGESYLREAKILFTSGCPEESIIYFTKALEQGVDPVVIGLSRGAAYIAQRMPINAEQDFTMVLDADPANERAYYFRGVARLMLGDYENAIKDLTHSLTKNHSRGIAYLGRGLAYAELGEEEDAALDFSTASSFSSAEVKSFINLFAEHKNQLNKTMIMLKRESAPWKTLLTKEEAARIRSWLS